jgi:hypothetical protein
MAVVATVSALVFGLLISNANTVSGDYIFAKAPSFDQLQR